MLISTQTSYLGQTFGDVEAVKIIAKAGFDAIDYSMFYMDNPDCPLHDDWISYAKKVKKTADECGIIFNQAHSPFPMHDGMISDELKEYIVRSMQVANIIEAPHTVMHPMYLRDNPEEQYERNLELFGSFVPLCEKYGVKIAIENLPGAPSVMCSTAAELNKLVDELGSKHFMVLVDVGHVELSKTASPDFIREIGHDRLGALHIQDHDRVHDLHTLPYLSSFDWTAIMKALKDIDYKGDLTFEADKFLRKFPKELAQDGSRFMYCVGKHLVNLFEQA